MTIKEELRLQEQAEMAYIRTVEYRIKFQMINDCHGIEVFTEKIKTDIEYRELLAKFNALYELLDLFDVNDLSTDYPDHRLVEFANKVANSFWEMFTY